MENDDSPTTLFKLYVTVIIHGHTLIVRYLLFMHPEENLCYKLVAQAIIDHPNMEIMKIFHAHQSNIVTLEFNHLQTFLNEACRGDQDCEAPVSNKTLTLIHYLLDNRVILERVPWQSAVRSIQHYSSHGHWRL